MRRAVSGVIRFIGVGLILLGGVEFSLEYARHRYRGAGISMWHCIIGSVLVLVGVILFVTSAKLAERLTDDSDE